MKIRKFNFYPLLLIMTFQSMNCFCQDIYGTWTVINCTLFRFNSNIETPKSFKRIEIAGNKFYFEKNTVIIKNSFNGYLQDSAYIWEPIDEYSLLRERSTKIRVVNYDQNNLTLKLDYPGSHSANNSIWYEIYLVPD